MRKLLPILAIGLVPAAHAQFQLEFAGDVPVEYNGTSMAMAWGGGLNCPQFSQIDLNGDGLLDLFAFDRSANKVITLLRQPGNSPTGYTITHAYDQVAPFQELADWVLLRDYNCDGKPDLFVAVPGAAGMAVYRNTSTGGALSFEVAKELVGSDYPPYVPNLYVPGTDVPGIADIDGDGDLDVLTFSIMGNYIDYHKNMSMEWYGTCDSLVYVRRNSCWGYFYENDANNSVTLHHECSYNVVNPESPMEPGPIADLLKQLRSEPDSAAGILLALKARHAGSTLTPIDLDGNGVMDLLLGDSGADNLVALTNGGEVDSAHMVTQDVAYPSYDQPISLAVFPGAYHVDVDNDGRKDLLVSPNFPSLSRNKDGVLYYRNTSTSEALTFALQGSGHFQSEMLDFGEGALPVLLDHNNDGLMDIVVANYGYYVPNADFPGSLALLENIGTPTAPAFRLADENFANLRNTGLGNGFHVSFGDLNGDGRPDMMVGDKPGMLHYYRNVSTGPGSSFTLEQAAVPNDQGTAIDVGQFATPLLHDLDDDGLLDLIVGERNGNLNLYRNVGTATTPSWQYVTDSLGKVMVRAPYYVTGYSVPFIHRNGSGARQLLCGSESGWIHHYDGIEGNLEGAWNKVSGTWQDLNEGGRSGVVVFPFRSDASPDAVVGNFRGGLSYWRNQMPVSVTSRASAGLEPFTLAPNPATNSVELRVERAMSDRLVELYDAWGRLVQRKAMPGDRLRMDLSELTPGTYLVRAFSHGTIGAQRLVVTGR